MKFQLFVTTTTGTQSYTASSLKEAKEMRKGWMGLFNTDRIEVWEGDKDLVNLRWVRGR